MKTIEQARDEYIIEFGKEANHEEDNYGAGFNEGLSNGFEEGVKFAQAWIHVSYELPDENETVLAKTDYNKLFVCKYEENDFLLNSGSILKSVTHWRPIEIK
ncbi:hypothetical protein Barb6_01956 [Bacteroidales bacterium Barb6]|nr:hypothetical protein Barb6_01956 [Bacteroidales bacterium Barb6]